MRTNIVYSKISKKYITKIIEKNHKKDFAYCKEEFEKILTCKIENDIFENIYFNSIYCPGLNTIEKINKNYVQDLFLKSNGCLPIAVKYLFNKNQSFNLVNNKLSDNYKKISDMINSNGYAVIKNFIDINTIKRIKEELDSFNYFPVTDIYNLKNLKAIKETVKKPASVYGSNLTSKEIKKDSEVYKLINSDLIKQVSEINFRSKPIFVSAVSMYTFRKDINTFSDIEKHMSAQHFHYDQSHLKFLKFFIYLSDIKQPSDGAHSFIIKTHESNLKLPKKKEHFVKKSLRVTGDNILTGAINDNWINENFSKKDIIDHCYPEGTVIIENTTGLHRGNNCTTNSRQVLSIIVATSAISTLMTDRVCTIENDNINTDFNSYLSAVNKNNKKIQKKVHDNMGFKITFIRKIISFLRKFISK